MRGGDGFVNQLGRVRGGDEACFVGGRAEGGVAVEHAVEEAFEGVDIGTRHVAVVLRGMGGEIQAEHTAHAVGGELDAVRFGGGGEPVGEAGRETQERFLERWVFLGKVEGKSEKPRAFRMDLPEGCTDLARRRDEWRPTN